MSKERVREIVKEMVEIHNRKNHDYGGSEYLSNFPMKVSQAIPVSKKVQTFG